MRIIIQFPLPNKHINFTHYQEWSFTYTETRTLPRTTRTLSDNYSCKAVCVGGGGCGNVGELLSPCLCVCERVCVFSWLTINLQQLQEETGQMKL